ncbi:RNA-directed DNA polymerase [Tanacetum coccineum]
MIVAGLMRACTKVEIGKFLLMSIRLSTIQRSQQVISIMGQIQYSEKYFDDTFEYMNVVVPPKVNTHGEEEDGESVKIRFLGGYCEKDDWGLLSVSSGGALGLGAEIEHMGNDNFIKSASYTIEVLSADSFVYVLTNTFRIYGRDPLPHVDRSPKLLFSTPRKRKNIRYYNQSAGLQTKLLRHTNIVASEPNFDDALCVFNTSMETEFLSNPSEIAAPKLMKKMADIYFTTVPISGLGQTMNACSRVFAGDIYGDHVVSCAGIIGIKHRHNILRDTLVDICYRSGILAGKEVDIGLDGGRDKPLHPTNMLLYL